jgi:hypothetical protein
MRSVSFERGNLLITIERFNKCIIADALIGANYSPKSRLLASILNSTLFRACHRQIGSNFLLPWR